jgi:hypothetical protein
MHRLDHTPKPFSTDDFFKPNRLPLGHWRLLTRGPTVSMRVRARLVIVLYEFTNQVVEMMTSRLSRCMNTRTYRSTMPRVVTARLVKKSQAQGISERQRLGMSFEIVVPGTAEFSEDLGVARPVLARIFHPSPKKGTGAISK